MAIKARYKFTILSEKRKGIEQKNSKGEK